MRVGPIRVYGSTWDSGRRTPPRAIVEKARRLKETDGGRLLPLQLLATEYRVHVRTLRTAVRDGRLAASFATRMAFGKRVAFASREDVEAFKRTYYRQTNQWNRPPRPAVCVVPDDYDRVLVNLRARLGLTQSGLAVRRVVSESDPRSGVVPGGNMEGRLTASFATRMAFGKLVAFASREAVEAFKRTYYRRTNQWNRPPRPAVCVVPDDYDRVLVKLRARLGLTQTGLAERIGAANKAVVYQWESRRRRPSPVLWNNVQALGGASTSLTILRRQDGPVPMHGESSLEVREPMPVDDPAALHSAPSAEQR